MSNDTYSLFARFKLFSSKFPKNWLFGFCSCHLIRDRKWIKISNKWPLFSIDPLWAAERMPLVKFGNSFFFLKNEFLNLERTIWFVSSAGSKIRKIDSIWTWYFRHFDPFRVTNQMAMWNSVKFDFLKIWGKKF